MTWAVATAWVAAGVLLAAGGLLRVDPRLEARLTALAGAASGRRDMLAAVGSRFPMPSARRRIAERLAAAGLPAEEVDRRVGSKVVLGTTGLVAGLAGAPADPIIAVLATAMLAAAGARLPEFLLARRAGTRRAAVAAAVPDLLDLIAVSVSAGSTPRLALERGTDATPGPLGEELAAARRAVALGGSWRASLREVAARTASRDLRRLAVTLDRTERLGAPVAARLRHLAREVRTERRLAQEERARRAPVAMLFPLVFLILPAFVLAAVVPAVLVATRGIH